MKAEISVRFLKNHGVRVTRTDANGVAMRFVPHGGDVTVVEAAAALGTYSIKLYRMAEAKRLRARVVAGLLRVPVSELWDLKRDPSRLEDGRSRARATKKAKA